MNNVCRVCLKENVQEKFSLNTKVDHRTVLDLIKYCSGVEISLNDSLPQFSCSKCIPLLISACSTKEMCIESDKALRDEMSVAHILGVQKTFEKDKRISKRKKENSPLLTPIHKFKCYLCDINFALRKEKTEHLEIVHGDDELKCKMCKHKSKTTRGLDNHMMLHANPELLNNMCHGCGKKFQKSCELRRHIKLTHGDKTSREINFYCDRCEFKTFSKMNIKRHLTTIHLGIKAYACKICPDKKYTSKITLDQHMITKHEQETDFICQCCKRKFPTMSFLRSHLKSACSGSAGHSSRARGDPNEYREPLENDKYRCKLCGIVCDGKGKISQHYAQRHKHNNACNLCTATFNSYSNLKKHIQILHNKIHKYSCSLCSRTFGQKNQLQSHIQTVQV